MDVLVNLIMGILSFHNVCVYIITLYTLNILQFCQFCLNKPGKMLVHEYSCFICNNKNKTVSNANVHQQVNS